MNFRSSHLLTSATSLKVKEELLLPLPPPCLRPLDAQVALLMTGDVVVVLCIDQYKRVKQCYSACLGRIYEPERHGIIKYVFIKTKVLVLSCWTCFLGTLPFV